MRKQLLNKMRRKIQKTRALSIEEYKRWSEAVMSTFFSGKLATPVDYAKLTVELNPHTTSFKIEGATSARFPEDGNLEQFIRQNPETFPRVDLNRDKFELLGAIPYEDKKTKVFEYLHKVRIDAGEFCVSYGSEVLRRDYYPPCGIQNCFVKVIDEDREECKDNRPIIGFSFDYAPIPRGLIKPEFLDPREAFKKYIKKHPENLERDDILREAVEKEDYRIAHEQKIYISCDAYGFIEFCRTNRLEVFGSYTHYLFMDKKGIARIIGLIRE